MVWGAGAPPRPLASLPWVATSIWSQSLGGNNASCCLRHCHGRRKRITWTSKGQWHQPWDGSCLWVLIALLCPGSCVCSDAPWPAPPQGSCHRQGAVGTGAVPRHSLQLLQLLAATNISENKEVFIFRVFLAVSCPMTTG